jgi:hypothetical protein
MFWDFKVSFVVNILAFLGLGDSLGNFLKNWAIFFKPSGHPDLKLMNYLSHSCFENCYQNLNKSW